MMKKDEKKAIVAGHICLDIQPVFEERATLAAIRPGQLIHTRGVQVNLGGAVANTGLAMQFFGARVELAAKIAEDEFGRLVLEMLSAQKIPQKLMIAKGESTSYSVVLSLPHTDRIFLHCPGANDTLSCEELKDSLLEDCTLFHFGYPTIMKNFYKNQGEQLIQLYKKVDAMGVVTSLDMASINEDSPSAEEDWKKILEATLPYVDFFVPSIEELCFMCCRDLYEEWKKRAQDGDIIEVITEKEAAFLAGELIDMGAGAVMVKCGAKGIYYKSGSMKKTEKKTRASMEGWHHREGFEKSFKPNRVLSAAGAGDVSIAAFLTAFLEGCTLEESVRMAAAAGAFCVEAYDALSGLKSFDTIRKRMADGWERNNICWQD